MEETAESNTKVDLGALWAKAEEQVDAEPSSTEESSSASAEAEPEVKSGLSLKQIEMMPIPSTEPDDGEQGDESIPFTAEPKEDESSEESATKEKVNGEFHHISKGSASVSRIHVKHVRLAGHMIRHPCRVILICLVVFVVICLLDSIKFELTLNNEHAYFINSNIKTHRTDAKTLAIEYISDNSVTSAPVKTQNENEHLFCIMWRKKGKDSILNSDDIDYIVSVENKVYERDPEGYFANCLSDVDIFPKCAANSKESPFRSISNGTGDSVPQEDIDALIKNSKTDIAALSSFETHFGTKNISRFYRGYFRFGLPYPDINDTHSSFRDKTHNYGKQADKFMDWAWPTFKKLQYREAKKAKKRGLELVVLSGRVLDHLFEELVNGAFGWVLFSIITVWCFMTFHLKSAFLSTMALVQILMGFPCAYFIYRYILWIPFFDTLGTMIIFVILGIGADDVFVYTDAWEQSVIFVMNPEDLVERMSFAFRRASKAMLVTQLTTFFAFLGTTLSPVIPIRAFGVWAALVVMCNYLLVITFYPATLSFWYQNLKETERKYLCCLCVGAGMCEDIQYGQNDEDEAAVECKPAEAQSQPNDEVVVASAKMQTSEGSVEKEIETVGEEVEKAADSHAMHKVERADSDGSFETTALRRMASIEDESSFEKELENGRTLERFLGTTFVDFINKFKYYLLVFYAALFCVTAYYASTIEGQDDQEKWFERDHYVDKMMTWPDKFYGGALNAQMKITLMWGPKERVDRSKVGPWDTEYYGEVQWDKHFDLSPSKAQQHIYDVCVEAQTEWSEDLYDAYSHESFSCFMFPFVSWVNETYNGTLEFPYVFDADNATAQKIAFMDLFREWVTLDATGNLLVSSGDVGYLANENKLYYVSVWFSLNKVYYVSVSERQDIYRRFQRRIVRLNDLAADSDAESVSRGFQTTTWAYAWLVAALAFVKSAVQGIAVALPLAFVVLIFSTSNWIVSLFAASTIVLILSTEVALMVWQGWMLGISESVAVVIMIGFSVDYVVHFSNAYVECEFSEKRLVRLRFSMFTMGISVIFGGMTTFGSGLFLYFPEMLFFRKFGIIIMSTVSFSLLFALTYFPSLMAAFGPEGNAGHVPVWQWVDEYITQPCKLCCKRST